ncbi:MAG: asparagine synthase (glutamine-hydrolyzing) [Planctomycetota bacterium]
MCGFVGIATTRNETPGVDENAFVVLRDRLTHRGPDDAGLFRDEHVWLGHRRLSVIDTSDAGRQPMSVPAPDSDDDRFTIVYNGELYNDDEVRSELAERGVSFRSGCDTETLLRAYALWGADAFSRVRGMFSAAIYDAALRTVTLVRDPLGVKPLYYALAGARLVFASEPQVVAAHPSVGAHADLRMCSAYTTTIRTVLGERTMYEGVRALRAGQLMRCDLSGARPVCSLVEWWRSSAIDGERSADMRKEGARVRELMDDSIRRHMRADVPVCVLLSGGLDSTITTGVAKRTHRGLRTYSAGADNDPDGDLSHAARVASAWGLAHERAVVDREQFCASWRSMVERQGVPLSTPNEVAIHAVASRLREDGCVVTISGESADELFGGYAQPLATASRYVAGEIDAPGPGAFELASNAWAPIEAKDELFVPEALDAIGHDAWLTGFYEDEFEAVRREAGIAQGARDLQLHLRFLRRVNLAGLLQRLDTATMLASVEGRTPFADAEVAVHAEALPCALKYDPGGEAPACTKRVLRAAYEDVVPDHVMHRDKASFPLPFTEWMGGHEELVRESTLLARMYRPEVIELIATRPREVWNLAWPAINLAMWGRSLA